MVVYSNALSVTVPPAPPVMEIELSASFDGIAVALDWYLFGPVTAQFDGYIVTSQKLGASELD